MSVGVKVCKVHTYYSCFCGLTQRYWWTPSRSYNFYSGGVRQKQVVKLVNDDGWYLRMSSKRFILAKFCLQCGSVLPRDPN